MLYILPYFLVVYVLEGIKKDVSDLKKVGAARLGDTSFKLSFVCDRAAAAGGRVAINKAPSTFFGCGFSEWLSMSTFETIVLFCCRSLLC